MDEEEKLQTVWRFYKAANDGDLLALSKLMTDDVIGKMPALAESLPSAMV